MLYIITGVILLVFVFSMLRDNRSIWNPALLIVGLVFSYISLLQILFDNDMMNVYSFTMLAGFLGIPFLILLSGIFLVYNGFILLKREGKSKVNFLSFAMGILIILFFVVMFIRAYGVSNYNLYNKPWFNIFFLVFYIFIFDFWLCFCRFFALFLTL